MAPLQTIHLNDKEMLPTHYIAYRGLSIRSRALISRLAAACALVNLPQVTITALRYLETKVRDGLHVNSNTNYDSWKLTMRLIEVSLPRYIISACVARDYPGLSLKSKHLIYRLNAVHSLRGIQQNRRSAVEHCLRSVVDAILERITEDSGRWCELMAEMTEHTDAVFLSHITTDYPGFSEASKSLIYTLLKLHDRPIIVRERFAAVEDCLDKILDAAVHDITEESLNWQIIREDIVMHIVHVLIAWASVDHGTFSRSSKDLVRTLAAEATDPTIHKDNQNAIQECASKAVRHILEGVRENSSEWQALIEQVEIVMAAHLLMYLA
ncbi:hypothetical protein EDD21DRAFT_350493 [Dissophora ornata]|nr:hypothetical protein EDD21DRAFT_350493 [Dissophora ornata]